jgi:hypothetical protein
MAIRASVTVSIAEETSGTRNVMLRDNFVDVSTSAGTTSDSAGSKRTSSKVRPSSANFDGKPVAVSSLVMRRWYPSPAHLPGGYGASRGA